MISVNNLSVSFTGQSIFDNVTFSVGDRDRIGLVGKNGAGKSTLLKILARWQEPTSGSIIMANGQSVGYLPQEMASAGNLTILDEALTAFAHIDDLECQQAQISQQVAERTDYESEAYTRLLDRLHDITERISLLGGDSRQEQAEKILLGLGFRQSDFHRSINEFSGGWQMRVMLAKLLLQHPDTLLLDEPTNHLDIESIQWLEMFLRDYPGAVVLVSHDRTFLDNITTRTIEITAGRIYDYRAPYSEYILLMQERRASQMAQLTAQQRQVAQIEAFIERFRYKATKAKQVQSRIKTLERMDRIQVDEVSTESIHFQFPPAPHSGKIVFEAANLGKAYGNHQVFDHIDMHITKGSKVAFVGRNGEGKSTLVKIIVGDIHDHTGIARIGAQVKIGYYAQNQAAYLDSDKTVFQTIDDIALGDIRPKIRTILGSFLFDQEDCDKKVRVLSGGEKARLALAKLLLTPCNLLILDEPTNHLDMDSKNVLKNALLQYDGTLILVSHDRDFLQGLTNQLFEFRNGEVHEFKGDIFEFLESRKIKSLQELDTAKKKTTATCDQPSQSQLSRLASKERERELRRYKSTVEKIEYEIERLEAAIAEKESELASTNNTSPTFFAEYQHLKDDLEDQMAAWESATITLEEYLNEGK